MSIAVRSWNPRNMQLQSLPVRTVMESQYQYTLHHPPTRDRPDPSCRKILTKRSDFLADGQRAQVLQGMMPEAAAS